MSGLPNLVAFAGYARAGKDEAAKAVQLSHRRHNFGDVIKRQVNPLVRHQMGFPAFTEDRDQKERIRRTLEAWGEDNYDAIMAEYFRDLPATCVNTRLVRTREAAEWRRRGGVIVAVFRPGVGPATAWEGERFEELAGGDWIDAVVTNLGTMAELRAKTLARLTELGRDRP